MIVFVFFTMLSGVMEDGGGMVTTQLNGAISSTDNILVVDTTAGFLAANVVIIGDEEITYTGVTPVSFTGCIRGTNNTDAVTHTDNTYVYSPESGVLNRSLGFNVIAIGEDAGALSVVNLTWNFLVKALPNIVMWDYSFLTGQLIIIRYLLMAVGVGIIVYFGFSAISTAFGIVRK